MKVNILASGSSGNCIALTVDSKTILIDAGIAKTKIEKALLNVDIRPDDVQAIFITHAHKDHTKGLPLANKYNIPVYAGEEEWKDISSVDEELQRSSRAGYADGIGLAFEAYAFETHHDSYQPLGYTIGNVNTGHKVSICLDTGKVDENMLNAMYGSDVYIIEANHEPKMVEACNRPNSVKTRILSDVGHLSNLQTAEALGKLIKGNGEQIYLVHLSSENNFPALAETTVTRELLKRRGLMPGKHYKLEVI